MKSIGLLILNAIAAATFLSQAEAATAALLKKSHPQSFSKLSNMLSATPRYFSIQLKEVEDYLPENIQVAGDEQHRADGV